MFFLKGVLIGFSIAAPVGPIGVLTIQRTLARGWRFGLATGLGAATADALYGAVAGFGLDGVAALLMAGRIWLQVLGGVFLCLLGLRIAWSRPATSAAPDVPRRSVAASYGSAVLLTLSNPMTILSFLAVFAGAGLAQAPSLRLDAAWLVLGVFGGSAVWWLMLSSGVAWWQRRSVARAWLGEGRVSAAIQAGIGLGGSSRRLAWINRLSGALLLGFGGWSLAAAAGLA
ncbi:MAG TPA: LysE family transporter [Candidatus Binatia bacterium]|nr:LysE family transporter [Candidatus Binatia bacterium]